MERPTKLCVRLFTVICGTWICSLWADERSITNPEIERIQITGSYIRHRASLESSSPLVIISQNDFATSGARTFADLTQTLTFNTGAQNNPDVFTQLATTGSSNINLRGLGVSSSLVLLNGTRQVVMAQQNNEGLNFVDTSALIPTIALDRIEIVKDGASALYGSDAVAGVVNFITKSRVDGVQLSADFQDGAYGNNQEYALQGLWGATTGNMSWLAAMSYNQRDPLIVSDHRLSRVEDDSSSLGSPGTYFVNFAGLGSLPIIDPYGCEEYGGIETLRAPAGTVDNYAVGFCRFDFGPYFSYAAEEHKLNIFLSAEYQFSPDISMTHELSYANNRAKRGGAPSNPILTSPVVPASHPQNPFAQDVAFFGRTLGQGTTNLGKMASETLRYHTSLQGEYSDTFWQISFTYAVNDYWYAITDVLDKEFKLALNGFAGRNCDPARDIAGQGQCDYFNPFSSSYTTAPNSEEVIDFISGEEWVDSKSQLRVVDALSSFELFDYQDILAELAVGLQYRNESLRQDYDPLANQDSFAFLIGNPDIAGQSEQWAVFAELGMVMADNAELQFALRYEDYEGRGSSLDPKLAWSWRFAANTAVRASVSTSFRAPSVFLLQGGATSLQQVSDPVQGTSAFVAVRSTGNSELNSEQARTWNIGLSFEPVVNWSLDLDYWHYDYSELIVQENAQAILTAYSQDPQRVVRANDPLNGPVVQINSTFVNASELVSSGLDLTSQYLFNTTVGDFSPSLSLTYIDRYDLSDPQAGKVDGLGKRNFTNFGVSTPELRFNLGLNWHYQLHSAAVFMRYIDGYADDQNCADGTLNTGVCQDDYRKIGKHITFDAQWNVNLTEILTSMQTGSLTIGATNLTNQDPPRVFTNSGYDSKVHDPRGRQVYVRLAMAF